MGQYVDPAAERVTNEEAVHAPRLDYWAMLNDEPALLELLESAVQIINLDSQLWHWCSRPTLTHKADLYGHLRLAAVRPHPIHVHLQIKTKYVGAERLGKS